jgi:hypothetical protein
MPQYTEADLMVVGQQLAQALQTLDKRLNAIEAKPVLDAQNQEWNAGRQRLFDRGLTAEEVDRTEDRMVKRGVRHHEDAIALGLAPEPKLVWGNMVPDAVKHAQETPTTRDFGIST